MGTAPVAATPAFAAMPTKTAKTANGTAFVNAGA